MGAQNIEDITNASVKCRLSSILRLVVHANTYKAYDE
jgi:hypothetical protein